jgi:hypothetical protein
VYFLVNFLSDITELLPERRNDKLIRGLDSLFDFFGLLSIENFRLADEIVSILWVSVTGSGFAECRRVRLNLLIGCLWSYVVKIKETGLDEERRELIEGFLNLRLSTVK